MEILILGRGKSALAVKKYLEKDNKITFAIEDNESLDQESIYKKDVDIEKYDLFFVSPGVKNDDPLLIKLIENNKKITSEIEYALSILNKHKIIAITGSNGKTTVATLLHYVLNKKGVKNVVGGNIGDPLINYANIDIDTYIILEISSFQLERLHYFKPYISIITNITPNHLDRHTYGEYIELKKKIYLFQDKNNFLIVRKKDYKKFNMFSKCNVKYIKNNYLKLKYLVGKHNKENVSIVIEVLKILNINKYKRIIEDFKGVKYRLEYLGKYNKTKFYNDSKSTTIYATISALKSIGRNTLLIIGGRNKNIDYSILKKYKVKEIIIFGEEAKITDLDIKKFNNLEEVFNYLKVSVNKYKNILFSPGFTSFDLYKDYIERGEAFEKLCKKHFELK